jgi:succinate-semialdehyde dehydrogenase / glutarate-semialdehyde dehydrogenase
MIANSSLLRQECLVGGRWLTKAEKLSVRNPADDTLLGTVPKLDAADVRLAIHEAAVALPGWAARTAADRASVLMRLHGLMLSHIDELATILTAEQGKPLPEARDEIRYGASYLEWFAEEGKRAYGDIIPSPVPDRRLFVLRQPVGVVAAITPWNFPSAMIARKIAPALAAGCTIVVKPAEQTPFSALALAALAERAGVPAGVISVVTGDAAEIGAELTASPVVRKLSFTGSTMIGELLYRQCAPTIKKLSLELGGNAPFIVFDDADLDAAVAGAIAAKFRNAGQTCVCANRILVQQGIHDSFVSRFAQVASQLTVGRGDTDGVQIGPLIDDRAVVRMQELIADALDGGARLATGGHLVPGSARLFAPTVLEGVTGSMACAQNEIFAPLAPTIRFTSEAEALELANDTPAGLAAYVFTRDAGRQWRMAEALETGMVGINTGTISSAASPFGGVKLSGLGREGSRHGLEDYMELKTMWLAA